MAQIMTERKLGELFSNKDALWRKNVWRGGFHHFNNSKNKAIKKTNPTPREIQQHLWNWRTCLVLWCWLLNIVFLILSRRNEFVLAYITLTMKFPTFVEKINMTLSKFEII